MNFKKLFAPIIAISLACASCWADDGEDWDSTTKSLMIQEYGFAIPYVEGLSNPVISFENPATLKVSACFDSINSSQNFLANYTNKLWGAGFDGTFVVYEDHISGQYNHGTEKTTVFYDETFTQRLWIDVDVEEDILGVYEFQMTGYLEVEYKTADNPSTDLQRVVDNIVGAGNQYCVPADLDGATLNYRYAEDARGQYLEVVIDYCSTSETDFINACKAANFSITEGDSTDDYKYIITPWNENNDMYIYTLDLEGTGYKYHFSFYKNNDMPTLYNAFPLDDLALKLNVSDEYKYQLPSFNSSSSYGFKILDYTPGDIYYYVAAVDPKIDNPSLDTLFNMYTQSLTEAGYNVATFPETGKATGAKDITGLGTVEVHYYQVGNLFYGGYTVLNS